MHTFLGFWRSNSFELFCSESRENKCYPNCSDICQMASADELFEAYQSTTDPDLFQVQSTCALFRGALLFLACNLLKFLFRGGCTAAVIHKYGLLCIVNLLPITVQWIDSSANSHVASNLWEEISVLVGLMMQLISCHLLLYKRRFWKSEE